MPAAPTFHISVPKEAIREMPATRFPGAIHMADTPERVDAAVAALMQERVIGFDTETKPSFKKGVVHKMALMQLSTLTDCYLIRINRTGITPSLRQLIENPDVQKIGLSIHDDFSVMHRSSSAAPSAFVELQKYVRQYGIIDASLQRIYAILFGEKISKAQRLTNWEAETLTPKQQQYAAIDAWACLRIWLYLESGKFDPASSPYKVTPEAAAPSAAKN